MSSFFVKSRFWPLLPILIFCGQVKSQVLPKEGSNLNYRIIGFSFEAGDKAAKYELEIATGNDSTESDFEKNVIQTFSVTVPKVIAEVPSFGCGYTWRTIYKSKGAKSIKSGLHHFCTGYCKEVDTTNQRLRILKAAKKYKDAYVLLDEGKVMYDMKGNPVWYLPEKKEFSHTVVDIKYSGQGSITFLTEDAYEIAYDGDVLWKAPNDGRISGNKGINENNKEQYHHQFSKLANGHYMVLGNQTVYVLKRWPSFDENNFIIADSTNKSLGNDSNYKETLVGTIIEYDKRGNVVWSWRSLKYFKESDIRYQENKDKLHDLEMHENAFFFDEKNKVIYLSYKTCSRILKIDYPSGKVINTYGEIFKPGVHGLANGLFYGQHACNISKDGYLYMYNNNMVDSAHMPQIIMLEEPLSTNDTLKKIWQYDCTMGGIEGQQVKGIPFTTGGNVMEMPGQSFFVSMGIPLSKLFIVSHNKEILWSALAERKGPGENAWNIIPQYRASIICGRKDLENLIWGIELPGSSLQ